MSSLHTPGALTNADPQRSRRVAWRAQEGRNAGLDIYGYTCTCMHAHIQKADHVLLMFLCGHTNRGARGERDGGRWGS